MAIAAINALKRDDKIRIITADANNLAPGLYLSDKSYIIPKFDDESFFPEIKRIVEKEKIDVIIPALDTILLFFSKAKKKLEGLGVKVLISDEETIVITRDKWKTYEKLMKYVDLPKSFLKPKQVGSTFPLFIKPRGGSGSINTYLVNSAKELNFLYEKVDLPIIQEYLEGDEYTVDCLADKDGNLIICVPRKRIETKAGISTKGKIVKNEKLEKMARTISKHINFEGPFFFQAKEDSSENPKLTEINARISGTMSLSSQSGLNIHSAAIRMAMGEEVKVPKIKTGVYISRYWQDIYIDESDLKTRGNNK
jgi:carbamoyl-phosphate synthase large subunit